MASDLGAINMSVTGRIVVSWVVTLPIGRALAALFFFRIKGAFS